MARRKNVKRIDPRYFLNETVNRLDEREGETPEDVAARLKNMPGSMRSGAVNDFFNMMDGSTDMAGHYPHVEDHREFAMEVLKLLGEIPASFRPFDEGYDPTVTGLPLGDLQSDEKFTGGSPEEQLLTRMKAREILSAMSKEELTAFSKSLDAEQVAALRHILANPLYKE